MRQAELFQLSSNSGLGFAIMTGAHFLYILLPTVDHAGIPLRLAIAGNCR